MPPEEDLAPVWTALSDSKRRQIVELLAEKPRTTGELCQFFDVSRFAVMKHLNVLEQAGLITIKREGRNRWNILNDEMVRFLHTQVADTGKKPIKNSEVAGHFPSRFFSMAESFLLETPLIQEELFIEAAPHQVFQALTIEIGAWWTNPITTESLGMHLEPTVNGRFYEAFDDRGQGELFGIITYIKQNRELRLQGGMGAENESITNNVRFLLEAENGGTHLFLRHRVIGPSTIAVVDSFRKRWDDLLNDKLKKYIISKTCPS